MKNKSPTISSNEQFQLLNFDTKIFGFKVAKILPANLPSAKLQLLLKKLQTAKFRLVYWQTINTNKKSQKIIEKLGGFLASKQVTYIVNLKKKIAPPKNTPTIEIYRAKVPTTAMRQLAIQIGIPSRFGTDPKIPKKSFYKIYHAWIKNSVKGTAADRVLVIRDKNKIVGMITLSSKNGRGDIRLVAVDAKCRGQKLGTNLIYAALNYFRKKGHTKAQVVTQKTNLPACCFYEKCGFHQEKTDNFYHFWL